MTSDEIAARTVMERCDILGSDSEEPGCLTRPFASRAMRQVNAAVAAWMQDAGMTVQQDVIGNLIGRYEASSAGAKTLLLGSHLDSVRDAGKYDGPLGVMIALACVERLHQRQERLPFAIEVLGFADEEGLRYQTAYLGSTAMSGTFDLDALKLIDAEGIAMADAIQAFGGTPDPQALRTPRWKRSDLVGYCEIHIEQGPVLEARDLPVGVVSAIAGQSRITARFTGEAGHAGTVPMPLRHDALCAAAEFVLAVEALGRSTAGLVATVGQISVQPGASNVIPGQVSLSLDVRHQDDFVREQACHQLEVQATEIGRARDVRATWQLLQEHPAVPCSQPLMRLWGQAIEELGYPLLFLPSGAGHDAAVMSELTDIGMLFVRCRGGISHNPAESVLPEDVAVAIRVAERFLLLLAREGGYR
jgi:allantoate deiminase